jgi:hypothetical protein
LRAEVNAVESVEASSSEPGWIWPYATAGLRRLGPGGVEDQGRVDAAA